MTAAAWLDLVIALAAFAVCTAGAFWALRPRPPKTPPPLSLRDGDRGEEW